MADGSARQPTLAYEDVVDLVEVAIREAPGLTLIGGQALNFWADHYVEDSPELQSLRQLRPFLSGDVDFLPRATASPDAAGRFALDVAGVLAVAEKMTQAVNGKLEKRGFYGPRATVATLTYRDEVNDERVVHFLGDMLGVDPVEVARTAIPVQGYLSVMNPVLCMESRISNVLDSEDYRNAHGRHQARVSIVCAREYVRELLAQGLARRGCEANERVFRFAKRHARLCQAEEFKPFDAVVMDDRLPENFRTIRYPRMLEELGLAPRPV